MTRIQCNKCGNYKDEIFIYTDESGENYCNNCKSAIQKQEQEQLSAYSWKVAHDIFNMTTEFLEKYIDKAGYYSDWEQRKQIHDNRVQRNDKNPEEAEKSFSTMLFLFAKNLKGKSSEFGEELKGEFYQLIDGAGIDVDNCPPRLGCVLIGIHEVLEGNSKKIIEDEKNAKEDYDINSPDYAKALSETFLDMQSPLDNEIETAQSLEGKNWKQITLENKFKNGNKELGKAAFERIKNSISVADYQKNFYFFPQKEQQIATSRGKVLTEKVKQNLHEWKIKEVVVFKGYGYFGGVGEVKELALVHKEANLKSYNWQGYLQFDSRMIYFKKDHQPEEWIQIEQHYSNRVGGSSVVKPNPQQFSNSEIIQDVKNNPRNWRKDEVITEYNERGEGIKRELALIHGSAEVGFDGAVYNWQQSIYLLQKFNQSELAEINQALGISQSSSSPASSSDSQVIRQEIVSDIRQGGFILYNINFKGNIASEKWFIRNSIEIGNNEISFDPKNMYKLEDLNEAEKQAIGYNKSEASLQNISSSVSEVPKDNKLGIGGILAIIGVIGALAFAGVFLVRKKLNSRSKVNRTL